MIGTKFNKLTIKKTFRKLSGGQVRTIAHAKCDCGKVIKAALHAIKSGRTISCGCVVRDKGKSNIGTKFGCLVVINTKVIDSKTWAFVKCDCGSDKLLRMQSLVSGATKSCGCLDRGKPKAFLTKGDIIGNWTVSGEPVVKQRHGRKVRFVEVTCKCGSRSEKNISALSNNHTSGCRSCVQKDKSVRLHQNRLNKGKQLLARYNKTLPAPSKVRNSLQTWVFKSSLPNSNRRRMVDIVLSKEALQLVLPLDPIAKAIWPWDDLGRPLPLNSKGKPIKQKKAVIS